MRDQQQGALVVGEQFFQQFERLDVEVVGRFVHHQQVGRLREQFGQQQAVALAAGQAGDRGARAFGREQEILQVADDVLALAVELDVLAALGHVVQGVELVVELQPVLVEVGDLDAGAQLRAAALRLELAQHDLQQGALAGAVRTDDADAVAAHHGGGEVVDQHAAAVGLVHVLEVDHLLAGGLRIGRRHLHVAAEVASLGAFHAQRLQRTHAALVAGTPGLDALADPHFLLCQLLVEQRIGLGFGMQAFLAPAQVVVVVAGPVGQRAAVDFDDARGQRAQEAAVVGDEDDAAGELLEEAFQPADRFDVEVVGGLVQQQHVGLAHQRLRQQHAALHAAGQRGEVGFARKLQLGQHVAHAAVQVPAVLRLDLVLHVAQRIEVALVEQVVVARQQVAEVAQSLGDHVEHAAFGAVWHFLRHPRDHHAVLYPHLAIVGMQLAGDQLHQGGFAFAVAADDAHPLVRLDRQIDMFEQERAADAEVDALQLDERHPPIIAGAYWPSAFEAGAMRIFPMAVVVLF